MPVINVRGLPGNSDPENLSTLMKSLKSQVAVMLGISSEQVTIFFPTDLLQEGLGEEIIITVEGLFSLPDRTT